MNLPQHIEMIGAPGRALAMRELRPLSDIEPERRAEFRPAWGALPPERRAEIVRAMVDLAEDNVDLQFQTFFAWCLDDDLAEVRVMAIEGLWESESPQVLRRLRDMLSGDPAPEVRTQAAIGLSRFAYLAELGELDDDLAAALLRSLLAAIGDRGQPIEVRRRALESAGYFASEESVARQIELAYTSEQQELRESALVAMGRSMLPRWLPAIGRELESRSPALRYEAARAAGELGEEGRPLVARVARLLGDSDTEVALAAIWALGQIGGDPARRVLTEAAKSESEARAQAATDALAELSLEQGLITEGPRRPPRGGELN